METKKIGIYRTSMSCLALAVLDSTRICLTTAVFTDSESIVAGICRREANWGVCGVPGRRDGCGRKLSLKFESSIVDWEFLKTHIDCYVQSPPLLASSMGEWWVHVCELDFQLQTLELTPKICYMNN